MLSLRHDWHVTLLSTVLSSLAFLRLFLFSTVKLLLTLLIFLY